MEKKLFAIATISLFVFAGFVVLPTQGINVGRNITINEQTDTTSGRGYDNIEYWALMVGVDYEHGENIFGPPFEYATKQLYKTLLVSGHWKADHIKLLIDKNATMINIIRGFRWLRRVADKNDVVLVYYFAHGGQLAIENKNKGIYIPIDLPPFDENDRCDEYLTTYWSGTKPFTGIWDDLFSWLLNSLRSNNICVVIESCYSGGMNDIPKEKHVRNKMFISKLSKWIKGFLDDMRKDGRIMIMSAQENETAIGSSPIFTQFLTEGLQGFADINDDGMCSAEETFTYANTRFLDHWEEESHPVIDDRYSGEFLLTDTELPPEIPELSGSPVAKVEEACNYSAFSIDAEGDRIKYGWDWHTELPLCQHEWCGAVVDEWTDWYESGELCNLSHTWNESGIYYVRAKACDIHGAERLPHVELWSKPVSTIICLENETVDQWQTVSDICYRCWKYLAQSFKPNSSNLTKIKLRFQFQQTGDSFPLTVTIRENITGENLTKISKTVETSDLDYQDKIAWLEFIPNEILELTPNSTYYIVLKCDYEGPASFDWYGSEYDPYQYGEAYSLKVEGTNWKRLSSHDFCFVTYS